MTIFITYLLGFLFFFLVSIFISYAHSEKIVDTVLFSLLVASIWPGIVLTTIFYYLSIKIDYWLKN